ncbi:type II toxin-antitoxin system toxin DNA ADP-ribosyl transferase DarT [Flexivirga oryzae]|uniref:DarT domain-containing protein n=1 Tax=Flexivirga oryzae TaxID=1794944 RepID=A0A839MZG1_9MICO|nr:DUF4433 domain-containing protein [Flexivirga oryzae]MBB2890808.1 hypothetical protein [Flexivirga oryzae]
MPLPDPARIYHFTHVDHLETIVREGVVADYVPFYFAPRSPMMFSIHCGNVPTYQGGCEDLIYLVSSVQRIAELRLRFACTDRNAALDYAEFSSDEDGLGALVDWQLMKARMWANTEEDPDRRERRMAECLVHATAPWTAILAVVAKSPEVAARAQSTLDRLGAAPMRVSVRPEMYF